ncbi:MAG: SGNH/GDSL hydrolase family protein [Chloroflexi bacterium]|nr:SGNH/GDSL hydrolase family protein [Chloroflexota bacterium]
MRILRLTNSSDLLPSVPEHLRSTRIAESVVAELTGEPVDTAVRVFWPTEELPDIVERWIDRFEPDVLFIRAAAFCCSYESVPLRLERKLGPLGKPIARAAVKASASRVGHAGAFHAVRRLAVRTIGGDFNFEPEEATAIIEAVFRRALSHESLVPVMRGPGMARDSTGTPAGLLRAQRRNAALSAELAKMCQSLHILYAPVEDTFDASLLAEDQFHSNEAGQRRQGEMEGRAIARAWIAARDGVDPGPLE